MEVQVTFAKTLPIKGFLQAINITNKGFHKIVQIFVPI